MRLHLKDFIIVELLLLSLWNSLTGFFLLLRCLYAFLSFFYYYLGNSPVHSTN
jgi:hypothetical protein